MQNNSRLRPGLLRVEGNIKAYYKLTDAGFNKISFIQYPNGTKDFGDFTGDKDTRAHIVDV